jgi:hypothetical protein
MMRLSATLTRRIAGVGASTRSAARIRAACPSRFVKGRAVVAAANVAAVVGAWRASSSQTSI